MNTYWVPGINNLRTYDRWAFVEFTDGYEMQINFENKIKQKFDKLVEQPRVLLTDMP